MGNFEVGNLLSLLFALIMHIAQRVLVARSGRAARVVNASTAAMGVETTSREFHSAIGMSASLHQLTPQG